MKQLLFCFGDLHFSLRLSLYCQSFCMLGKSFLVQVCCSDYDKAWMILARHHSFSLILFIKAAFCIFPGAERKHFSLIPPPSLFAFVPFIFIYTPLCFAVRNGVPEEREQHQLCGVADNWKGSGGKSTAPQGLKSCGLMKAHAGLWQLLGERSALLFVIFLFVSNCLILCHTNERWQTGMSLEAWARQ